LITKLLEKTWWISRKRPDIFFPFSLEQTTKRHEMRCAATSADFNEATGTGTVVDRPTYLDHGIENRN
jgi:hypothetical protein